MGAPEMTMPEIVSAIIQLVTPITTVGVFLFGIGKFTQKMTNLVSELSLLRTEFHEHVKDDRAGFQQVNEALLKIATGRD